MVATGKSFLIIFFSSPALPISLNLRSNCKILQLFIVYLGIQHAAKKERKKKRERMKTGKPM